MILGRLVLGCVLVASTLPAAAAETSDSLHALINKHAKANGVPESLVHRVVRRESNYNPRAYSRGNWGLMQIRHGTARGMGYTGSAAGLLDANTNLSYAVPYLANAYRVAGGNPDRAVSLYASGFYYHAKRQGMLGSLKKGPIGGDAVAVAQAQPAQPTFGSWLATAFAPPGQAKQTVVAQQTAVTQQPVAMAQTQAEAAEEPAGSVSRRRGRQERLALAKAAALQSRTESKAQEAAPVQPAAQQLALRQAVSEAPEAAPAAKRTARRDRTAALSKTAALGSAAEPQAQTQAQAETPAQPPHRPAALKQAVSEAPESDAAPAAKRLTKRDRTPAVAKIARAEARPREQLARNGLALPPELATRR
jgi:Transglycosylase SLT domain